MTTKDKIVSWFIRNVILPRNEIIDKPGFIILKISEERKITNLREILIPEFIISEFEKRIIEKYKEIGRKRLYSIGKKFGYRFSLTSYYPTAKNEKEFANFSYFLVRYLEAIYADKITHEIDFENKKFIFKSWDWIVCNRNGIGYILSDGTGAGMLSYAFQDPSIEGIQTKCQGRGDKYCEILCAPEAYLKKKGIDFFKERDLSELEINLKTYNDINKVRPSHYAKNSLRTLLDSGFVIYKHGKIGYKGERFLLLESSIMYILEMELKKLKDGLEILWEVSFDWGKKMAGKIGKQDPCKFISDFMPGLGFGDVLALKSEGKYKVIINCFPWTKWAKAVNFTMFNGIVSGLISGFSRENVKFTKIKTYLSKDGFSLILKE